MASDEEVEESFAGKFVLMLLVYECTPPEKSRYLLLGHQISLKISISRLRVTLNICVLDQLYLYIRIFLGIYVIIL